jgi:hypothetical protein
MSTFVFLKVEKIGLKKQISSTIFFTNYCNHSLQNKIPQIIHLTNQHQMNQSFPCIYGSILEENFKKIIFFGILFGFL